jgi:hypothetical protein
MSAGEAMPGLTHKPPSVATGIGRVTGGTLSRPPPRTHQPAKQGEQLHKRYAAIGKVFPITIQISTECGKHIINFLSISIPQAEKRYYGLDKDTAIVKNLFQCGRLGDYPIDVLGASDFEDYIRQHGMQRNSGDAILLLAKLEGA